MLLWWIPISSLHSTVLWFGTGRSAELHWGSGWHKPLRPFRAGSVWFLVGQRGWLNNTTTEWPHPRLDMESNTTIDDSLFLWSSMEDNKGLHVHSFITFFFSNYFWRYPNEIVHVQRGTMKSKETIALTGPWPKMTPRPNRLYHSSKDNGQCSNGWSNYPRNRQG